MIIPLLLTLAYAPVLGAALTNWEQIHQTLHTYPLAIDGKDFALLSSVFAPNAFANYTGPLSNLTGLAAIESGLAASVASVNSQHLLGTTVIDIHGGNETGDAGYGAGEGKPTTANSTTYFQATLFGKPYATGELVTLYGYYADELVKLNEGWRISDRLLVFIGPGFVGNLTLVGM